MWLYNAYFKTVPLRSFLLWGNLLGAALQCSDLLLVTRLNTRLLGGLDDHLFVLGGSVVTSVIANVLAMPTLVLAARLCPKGLEVGRMGFGGPEGCTVGPATGDVWEKGTARQGSIKGGVDTVSCLMAP